MEGGKKGVHKDKGNSSAGLIFITRLFPLPPRRGRRRFLQAAAGFLAIFRTRARACGRWKNGHLIKPDAGVCVCDTC